MSPLLEVKDHPILITFQDTVEGAGFLARITVSGRTLVRQEEDGQYAMYGVRPAAIAESGGSIEEAFLRFKQAHYRVMLDMAQESNSFEEFRNQVENFFNEVDSDEAAWEEALQAIRCNNFSPPEPFAQLPRQSPAQRPARIEVERVDSQIKPYTASNNVAAQFYVADRAA